MFISVVIPTRNNSSRLLDCLSSLLKQALPHDCYEVLVVDNGSNDATPQVLANFASQHRNLRWETERSAGRARARNCGIRSARGELLVFLDDDIEVGADHLQRHLDYHRTSTESLAVFGRILDVSPIHPKWLEDYFHAKQLAGTRSPDSGLKGIPLGLYFTTGNVSLKRTSLEMVATPSEGAIEYFDPAFKVREDGDLGCRLVSRGVKFHFSDDIVCRHHHPRDFCSAKQRSYDAGFSLVQLIQKHSIADSSARRMTRSRALNNLLCLTCYSLFPAAWLVRPVWAEPFRKIVGGLLLYHCNRGFRDAWNNTSSHAVRNSNHI